MTPKELAAKLKQMIEDPSFSLESIGRFTNAYREEILDALEAYEQRLITVELLSEIRKDLYSVGAHDQSIAILDRLEYVLTLPKPPEEK